MALSVERPTSAQVTISRFVGSSPASGSVPTARSLEPASGSVSPSLSALPVLALCLSKINKCEQKCFKISLNQLWVEKHFRMISTDSWSNDLVPGPGGKRETQVGTQLRRQLVAKLGSPRACSVFHGWKAGWHLPRSSRQKVLEFRSVSLNTPCPGRLFRYFQSELPAQRSWPLPLALSPWFSFSIVL